MRRIIPAISIVIVFMLLFAIPALKQKSNERDYLRSMKLDKEREVEIQNVIDAGVANFTPSYSEFYWPGCTFYKYKPTAFEAGFCDGTNLAHTPFNVGAGLYKNQGIAALYLELVSSKDDGKQICELSTDIKQWRFVTAPTFDKENANIDMSNQVSRSEYVAGCQLGILKSFNIGVRQELLRVERVKKITESGSKPEETSPDSGVPSEDGVDRTSSAYLTMFNVGRNFSKVSLATDSAQSQCKSALNNGIISAQGIPRYLGVQATMIQSLLKTKSGWQGCLDGFGQSR